MDPVKRIIEALTGRPELAHRLRTRLVATVICGPWTPLPPQNDGDPPRAYMRRNINQFTDILAHATTTGEDWKYLITAGEIGRVPGRSNNWTGGFPTPESAMAAADQVLMESGQAILAPDGTTVQYQAPLWANRP